MSDHFTTLWSKRLKLNIRRIDIGKIKATVFKVIYDYVGKTQKMQEESIVKNKGLSLGLCQCKSSDQRI